MSGVNTYQFLEACRGALLVNCSTWTRVLGERSPSRMCSDTDCRVQPVANSDGSGGKIEAIFREYEQVGDVVRRSTAFSFSEDGSILISKVELNGVRESSSHANMAPNWANYPEFGEYALLCNENRVGE